VADQGRAGPTAGSRPNQCRRDNKQRVAIARALITDPCSCSPTNRPATRHEVVDEVAGLLKQVSGEWGRAVLMVTHDPRIAAYADRIVFLKDGKVVNETQLESKHTDNAESVSLIMKAIA